MEKHVVVDNVNHQLTGWRQYLLWVVLFFALTGYAEAHVLESQSGWAHPLSGLDHILAMVSVGAWSAILGGRAIWLVPTFFVLFMFIGSLIGINQIELLYTEQGIALSVIILGVAIAIKGKIPTVFAALCTALFGVCHGYAHGYELTVIDDALFYILGFISTTILLHIVGLIAGHYLLKTEKGKKTLQFLGAICAVLGAYLLFETFSN